MSSQKRTLLLVVLVCVIATGGLVSYLYLSSVGRTAEVIRHYNDVSRAAKARAFPRAVDPPGWKLQPGKSEASYHTARIMAETSPAPRDALSDAFDALSGQGDSKTVATRSSADKACVALGVPTDSKDPVVLTMDQTVCELMGGWAPAFAAISEGSRRSETKSPAHIWAPVDPNGNSVPLLSFIQLAKANLLRAHLEGVAGDREAQLQRIFETLRFANDLGQGATLLGCMVSVAAQELVADALQRLITDDTLTLDQATMALAEIQYVSRHPISSAQCLSGEYVFMAGVALKTLGESDADVPPSVTMDDTYQGNDEWNMAAPFLMRDFLFDIHEFWADLLPALEGTRPARRAAFERQYSRMAESVNPLTQIAIPSLEKYDVQLTAAAARLGLLQIAFADLVYRRQRGVGAASLEAISKGGLSVGTVDPLVDAPYRLESQNGVRIVRSAMSEKSHELAGELDSGRHEKLTVRLPDSGKLTLPAEPPDANSP